MDMDGRALFTSWRDKFGLSVRVKAGQEPELRSSPDLFYKIRIRSLHLSWLQKCYDSSSLYTYPYIPIEHISIQIWDSHTASTLLQSFCPKSPPSPSPPLIPACLSTLRLSRYLLALLGWSHSGLCRPSLTPCKEMLRTIFSRHFCEINREPMYVIFRESNLRIWPYHVRSGPRVCRIAYIASWFISQ